MSRSAKRVAVAGSGKSLKVKLVEFCFTNLFMPVKQANVKSNSLQKDVMAVHSNDNDSAIVISELSIFLMIQFKFNIVLAFKKYRLAYTFQHSS